MIDSVLGFFKFIIIACLVIWLAWMGITHAAEVGNFVVTVINGIKTFFMTLWNGVF